MKAGLIIFGILYLIIMIIGVIYFTYKKPKKVLMYGTKEYYNDYDSKMSRYHKIIIAALIGIFIIKILRILSGMPL